ncbi:hypothetical protein [Escherichia coli]
MNELKSWLNKQVVLCSVLWQGEGTLHPTPVPYSQMTLPTN